MFDHGVLIDYHSTDRSREICRELAPHWEVRTSRNLDFAAVPCDQEVMEIERGISGWKLALNTTEFLFHPDLNSALAKLEGQPQDVAFGIRSVVMVDDPAVRNREIDPQVELPFQCRHGWVEPTVSRMRRPRWIHRAPDGQYHPGRHVSSLRKVMLSGIFHLWFGWAPMDQVVERKLQIQTQIPTWDRALGHGTQHLINREQLEAQYQSLASEANDLWTDPEYRPVLEKVAAARGYPLPK